MAENDNRTLLDEDVRLDEDVPPPSSPPTPDSDALLVALILAPASFSRNKFFELFRQKDAGAARRRAQLIRSLILEMTEPWPHSTRVAATKPPLITRREREDGFLELIITADEFNYRRIALLTKLEGAALDYALHRALGTPLDPEAHALVTATLARHGQAWLGEFP